MKKFLLSVAVAAMAMSASAANWFCIGAFNGWNTVTLVEADQMTEVETNVFQMEVATLTGDFLFVPGEVGGTPDWDNKILPNGEMGNVLTVGEEYYGVPRNGGADGQNFTVDGEVKNAVIKLDLTDAENPVILLTGDALANEYTQIDMVGAINGIAWDENRTDFPIAATNDDKTEFSATYELTDETSYLKFKAGNNLYGGVFDGEGDVVVEGASASEFALVKSGKTFAVPAGKYTITIKLPYNGKEGTIVFADGSGAAIEGVEADNNVAPVYYNLQGVRVDNAANGLYIVVRGDKAAKEFVR